MDVLNLQPDAGDVQDTTFEVEGYQDHVEEIENAYPEELAPAEENVERMQQASDDAFNPGSVAQESPLNVAEGVPQGQPTDQPQQPEQQVEQQPEETEEPSKFNFTPDENGYIDDEQLQAAYGDIPEGVKYALKMNLAYDKPKEDRLGELF